MYPPTTHDPTNDGLKYLLGTEHVLEVKLVWLRSVVAVSPEAGRVGRRTNLQKYVTATTSGLRSKEPTMRVSRFGLQLLLIIRGRRQHLRQ